MEKETETESNETETERAEIEKRQNLLRKLVEEEKSLDEKLSQLKQKLADRNAVMNALHEYNDIKDATQVVLGQLAVIRGVTVKELHEKFDLPIDDG